jgi:predicted acyltransferase
VDEKGENVYTSALPWFYQNVCKNIASDLRIGSFIYALCFITFFALLAYVLDKKKIYIKV